MPEFVDYYAPQPRRRPKTTPGTLLVAGGLLLAMHCGCGSLFTAGAVERGEPDSGTGLCIMLFSLCVGVAMVVMGAICLKREHAEKARLASTIVPANFR